MKNLSVSTDGGKTWKAIADKVGGMGCILAFADAKTGVFGFGAKFQMTTDGGATWKELALPKDVSKVAAISLRTPTDGYLVDDKGGDLYPADQGHRDLGDETTPTRQTLLESPNDSRGGRDFGHDDPFGNRLYRSLS